jgi:hypothetical protein
MEGTGMYACGELVWGDFLLLKARERCEMIGMLD